MLPWGDNGPGTGVDRCIRGVLVELVPASLHARQQYADNTVEVGHGRLKVGLGPMRGLERFRSGWIVVGGHAWG